MAARFASNANRCESLSIHCESLRYDSHFITGWVNASRKWINKPGSVAPLVFTLVIFLVECRIEGTTSIPTKTNMTSLKTRCEITEKRSGKRREMHVGNYTRNIRAKYENRLEVISYTSVSFMNTARNESVTNNKRRITRKRLDGMSRYLVTKLTSMRGTLWQR